MRSSDNRRAGGRRGVGEGGLRSWIIVAIVFCGQPIVTTVCRQGLDICRRCRGKCCGGNRSLCGVWRIGRCYCGRILGHCRRAFIAVAKARA